MRASPVIAWCTLSCMTSETAATVSAVAAAVSTALTLVAVVIAVRSLAATRKDSRDRSRPVIVPELQRELLSHGTTNLLIRNLGTSVAANVSVQFEPGPPEDLDSLPGDNMWKWIFQAYARPIASWAPTWTLSNVVRAGHEPLDPFAVIVNYAGPDGTRYTERHEIDPTPILKATSSGPSDTKEPFDWEKRKVRALEAMVRQGR